MVKTSVRKWREPFTCSQVKEGSLVIQSHAALKTPSLTFQRHLISLIYRYQAKIVLWSTFNVKNVQDFLWFEKCKIAMNVWIHNKDGELIYQFNCMVVAFRTMLSAACEVMSLRLFNKNNIHKNYQGALPLLYYKPTETRETFCIIINFCSFMHPFFFASLSGSHCCVRHEYWCHLLIKSAISCSFVLKISQPVCVGRQICLTLRWSNPPVTLRRTSTS